LPGEAEVRSTRRWVMVQSHILPVVAVIAVFWARGW
jgi:putative membrane protein